nr:MAG TPA: single-stranded-DNA-specific exonuclease RecJ [Caudoviricetes sp.]
MLSRGITSLDRAREFFGCSSLSDPLLIKDMEAAVEVIRGALDEGKKITFRVQQPVRPAADKGYGSGCGGHSRRA